MSLWQLLVFTGYIEDDYQTDTKIRLTHSYHITFPFVLPSTLIQIRCEDNKYLTALPENLPTGLEEIICDRNNLTKLPDKLPTGLIILKCSQNKLTKLPELPATLKSLDCSSNDLDALPMLPTTLTWLVYFGNNKLLKTYPKLDNFENVKDKVAYVNKINRAVKQHQAFVVTYLTPQLEEAYARKTMHPARFQPLLDNPELNVDEFMSDYISTL
jgi:hypothetical protein